MMIQTTTRNDENLLHYFDEIITRFLCSHSSVSSIHKINGKN